jgi:hypothetical protein
MAHYCVVPEKGLWRLCERQTGRYLLQKYFTRQSAQQRARELSA